MNFTEKSLCSSCCGDPFFHAPGVEEKADSTELQNSPDLPNSALSGLQIKNEVPPSRQFRALLSTVAPSLSLGN